jgi:hypothetical protein
LGAVGSRELQVQLATPEDFVHRTVAMITIEKTHSSTMEKTMTKDSTLLLVEVAMSMPVEGAVKEGSCCYVIRVHLHSI